MIWRFFTQRLKSFRWAFKGLLDLYSHHPNAQVHLLATIVVLIGVFYWGVSTTEACLLVLCIVLVTAMEAMNSAVEYLADKISSEQDPLIGKAKDIAAAAVLLCSIGAALVGGFIFVPKILAGF